MIILGRVWHEQRRNRRNSFRRTKKSRQISVIKGFYSSIQRSTSLQDILSSEVQINSGNKEKKMLTKKSATAAKKDSSSCKLVETFPLDRIARKKMVGSLKKLTVPCTSNCIWVLAPSSSESWSLAFRRNLPRPWQWVQNAAVLSLDAAWLKNEEKWVFKSDREYFYFRLKRHRVCQLSGTFKDFQNYHSIL